MKKITNKLLSITTALVIAGFMSITSVAFADNVTVIGNDTYTSGAISATYASSGENTGKIVLKVTSVPKKNGVPNQLATNITYHITNLTLQGGGYGSGGQNTTINGNQFSITMPIGQQAVFAPLPSANYEIYGYYVGLFNTPGSNQANYISTSKVTVTTPTIINNTCAAVNPTISLVGSTIQSSTVAPTFNLNKGTTCATLVTFKILKNSGSTAPLAVATLPNNPQTQTYQATTTLAPGAYTAYITVKTGTGSSSITRSALKMFTVQ